MQAEQTAIEAQFESNSECFSSGKRTGGVQIAAYSLPTIVTTFLTVPMVTILPGLYAKHLGLALTSIAAIMLAARIFDAVTDPLTGYLSDQLRRRFGTRKPLIAIGGILVIISSYFLYVPPANVGDTYFLISLLVFYFSWTLFEIPHVAWGGELSRYSKGKTRIYSWRFFSINLGLILFYLVPLLPFFPSQEFTLVTMKWSALMATLAMAPLLYFCIKTVPNGHYYSNDRQAGKRRHKDTFSNLLASIVFNKPLWIFFGSYLFAGAGIGMWLALAFIFIDAYLGLGAYMPMIYAFGAFLGLVSIKGWHMLADKFSKKRIFAVGMLLNASATFCTSFIEPNASALIWLTIIVSTLTISASASSILSPSILSDIVDYGAWKFGNDIAATYFAVFTFITKANIGIGGALGLWITGWYGFNPTFSNHSEESLAGLRMAIAYIPALFVFASLFFIGVLPITERRHGIIRRRLAKRSRYNAGNSKKRT